MIGRGEVGFKECIEEVARETLNCVLEWKDGDASAAEEVWATEDADDINKENIDFLRMHLFTWTFACSTSSSESTRAMVSWQRLYGKKIKIEKNRIIRRMGAQSVEQGSGERSFINGIIGRDSNKHAEKQKWEHVSSAGRL
jgi:hypothetical protein